MTYARTFPRARAVFAWTADHLAFMLVLLTLILFFSKSLYNVPFSLMALMGLARTIKSPHQVMRDPATRACLLLFLCLWLPQLISLIDAVNPAHTSHTVFPYLRFFFAGVYIIGERGRIFTRARLLPAVFCVASVWSVDAAIQYLAGVNLLGYPYETGHITGMFYPRNTIAHVLAALSPLYFESLRLYGRRYRWIWLLLIPLFLVILLSGRRAAWLMLILGVAGYGYYLFRLIGAGRAAKRAFAAAAVVVLAAAGLLIFHHEPLQTRISTTAGIFSLDYETTDLATARRLPIWETAVAVFRDNWINGIGPRGFRHVYGSYSGSDDFWHDTGTTHPHQLVLEVLAETGLIGLTGLVLFAALYCRYLLAARPPPAVVPWLLCVLLVLFPVNSNPAFYGSYWATLTWWFLILSLAVAGGPAERRPGQARPGRGMT